MTSDGWQPVVRVGEPKFVAGIGNRIKVELKTKGWLSRDWRGYFGSQVSQQRLDARYSSLPCWDEVQRIEGSCAHDDAEHYIELIDAAIHYANTKFRSQALPEAVVNGMQQNRGPTTVRDRQAALDDLAKKLAKPEYGDRATDDGAAAQPDNQTGRKYCYLGSRDARYDGEPAPF
jgi:hypothetical protein